MLSCVWQEAKITVREFLLAVESKLLPTDDTLEIQKEQNVRKRTKGSDVGEEHLSVNHPEKEIHFLQAFQCILN